MLQSTLILSLSLSLSLFSLSLSLSLLLLLFLAIVFRFHHDKQNVLNLRFGYSRWGGAESRLAANTNLSTSFVTTFSSCNVVIS
ncbi:hypothetical protein CGRA01v4_04871 [Colletotrichum graminicola]|nr:hypothetical protein CGRA01v4_04871 [Colletotrichum graminicola]